MLFQLDMFFPGTNKEFRIIPPKKILLNSSCLWFIYLEAEFLEERNAF